MSSFIASNNVYNIQTEKEISDTLAEFSPEFVMDTIKYRIEDRFNAYQIQNPNLPAAWEQYFKQLQNNYPMNIEEIENTRIETYQEIINIIAESGDFVIRQESITDFYSIAFYLYDFFIANFANYMVTFFTNFIIKEKNGIYDVLNLASRKRNKDSSTIYNKRLDKNIKLAIINSNLEYVIDSMFNFDISFHNILENIYGNTPIIQLLENICLPKGDFYKSNYLPVLSSNLKPIIITNIRMSIQRESASHDEIDITKEM